MCEGPLSAVNPSGYIPRVGHAIRSLMSGLSRMATSVPHRGDAGALRGKGDFRHHARTGTHCHQPVMNSPLRLQLVFHVLMTVLMIGVTIEIQPKRRGTIEPVCSADAPARPRPTTAGTSSMMESVHAASGRT